MKFIVKHRNLWFVLLTVWTCLWLTGCSAWTTQATNILNLLGPAVEAALGILSAFGIGIPASVLQQFTTWSTAAKAAFAQVAILIQEYQTAVATAQPGILGEIQAAIDVVAGDLTNLLPLIKVTAPKTQAIIAAVFGAISAMLVSLVNLLPVLKGEVTDHEEARKRIAAVKSAKEFKTEFNQLTSQFGAKYQI